MTEEALEVTEEVVDDQQDSGEQLETVETEIVLPGEESAPDPQLVPAGAIADVKRKLKGKLRDAEGTNANLEQQLAEKDRTIELLRLANAPKEEEVSDVFPTLEQHDYDEGKYAKAVSAYHDSKTNKAVQDAINEFRQQTEQTTQSQSFESDLDAQLTKHHEQVKDLQIVGYDDALAFFSEKFTSNSAQNLIAQDLVDAKTIVYLHKNPAKAEELAELGKKYPAKVIKKFGELSASLTTKSNKTLPDPDEPLDGGSAGGSSFERQIETIKKKRDDYGNYDFRAVLDVKKKALEQGVVIP